jgi:hypothetical protein
MRKQVLKEGYTPMYLLFKILLGMQDLGVHSLQMRSEVVQSGPAFCHRFATPYVAPIPYFRD